MGFYDNVENGLKRLRRVMLIEMFVVPILFVTIPFFSLRLIIGSIGISCYIFRLIGMGVIAKDIKLCYVAFATEIIIRVIDVGGFIIPIMEQIYSKVGNYIEMVPMLIVMFCISKEVGILGRKDESMIYIYYAIGVAVATIVRYTIPNMLSVDENVLLVSLVVSGSNVAILVLKLLFLNRGIAFFKNYC